MKVEDISSSGDREAVSLVEPQGGGVCELGSDDEIARVVSVPLDEGSNERSPEPASLRLRRDADEIDHSPFGSFEDSQEADWFTILERRKQLDPATTLRIAAHPLLLDAV